MQVERGRACRVSASVLIGNANADSLKRAPSFDRAAFLALENQAIYILLWQHRRSSGDFRKRDAQKQVAGAPRERTLSVMLAVRCLNAYEKDAGEFSRARRFSFRIRC